ncbi:MAG: efflux RND transporter permease subunit [Treponema sp.]|jgi:HAE1 family hydrophobic/amphiphilic exporter-1|nr:efflux RND transporter permease subunit [Treponema sp.]
MNIAGYSVKRPVTIVVLYVLALGVAATLVPNIAVDLFPSADMPVLSVYTSYPGAGPSDVEQNVTAPLERALASAKGLTNMTSSSSFQSSSINLNFDYGTDMDKMSADIQSMASRVNLPDNAGSPTVRRFDMSASPIMNLVVRGNYPADQLRIYAEDEIQAQIERIEGVAAASVTGGTTQQIEVSVSLNRLAAFNLTLNEVRSALSGQSVLSSGGSLLRGDREYRLLATQELTSIEQIKRLVVKTISVPAVNGMANRSQVVRLEDIADISVKHNDNAARVYVNGETGVYIQVTSESDSNQMRVSARVREALDGINATLPQGITLDVLTDNTTMISATMNQVYTNAIQGILLAMLVLFIFLRNIKSTFIIGLSMPISILLTLVCMVAFGFTLNLLSMTGLILGLGMTVDASIVILENAHNYRLRGAKADIATILGSQEMFRAIITSTTTTLCVFIPLIIYKNDLEMIGQYADDLIFTVMFSLACSLVVALTLVPALAGSILRLDTRKQKPLRFKFMRVIDDGIERMFTAIDSAYVAAINYCLDHRLLVMGVVLVILVYSFMQFSGIGMNMFIRSRTDDSVNINVSMPQGTAIAVTADVMEELETIVKANVTGYKNLIRRASSTSGSIQITLPPPAEQIDTPDTIIAKLTPLINVFPGAQVAFRAGRSMSSTSAVAIAISSRDVTALTETANDIRDIMVRYLPAIENPTINIDEGAPQLGIEINRERAAALGVSLSSVSSAISMAIGGFTATTLTQGDRNMNVIVRLNEADRSGLPNLDAILVSSRAGLIPISNLTTITEGRSPTSIRHENQERVVRISGELSGGMAATEVQAELEATIKQYLIPREGVTVRYVGEAQEVQAYTNRFMFIIATAIFLVFGLMASQFESFVDPAIIFFSIPLLFIGVIWIYKIGNEAMSIFSAVGIVALVGVVVNNGIVLVDYTNTLRARGMLVREACLAAGRSRLRPIMMTGLTTIFSMIPIAFFPGSGTDTIQPIGKTFVGGLSVSFFMTLLVTPVMYSLLNSRRDKKLLRQKAQRAQKVA